MIPTNQPSEVPLSRIVGCLFSSPPLGGRLSPVLDPPSPLSLSSSQTPTVNFFNALSFLPPYTSPNLLRQQSEKTPPSYSPAVDLEAAGYSSQATQGEREQREVVETCVLCQRSLVSPFLLVRGRRGLVERVRSRTFELSSSEVVEPRKGQGGEGRSEGEEGHGRDETPLGVVHRLSSFFR